jgi:hypothetical protein
MDAQDHRWTAGAAASGGENQLTGDDAVPASNNQPGGENMLISGSTQSVWMALAISLASHHADSFAFDSLEPTVTSSRSENLELTMTITPDAGSKDHAELAYELDYKNISTNLLVNLVIENPIPEHAQFRVGSATKGTPPDAITEVTPLFSNDGGRTWNYNPVSGGGGAPRPYDASVTHVRFMLSGVLAPGVSSTTGVGFKVRVKPN